MDTIQRLNNRRKYSLLVSLLILIAFTCYFYFALQHMHNVLLSEKFIDKKFEINLICDQADRLVKADKNWDTYDYKTFLSDLVTHIDSQPSIYAEMFDKDFYGVSLRIYETEPFDPWEHDSLAEAIRIKDRGEMSVSIKGENWPQHFYWRWVPTDKSLQNRFLVIVGASNFSVSSSIECWVIYGIVGLIVVSAIFIVGALILLNQRGRN